MNKRSVALACCVLGAIALTGACSVTGATAARDSGTDDAPTRDAGDESMDGAVERDGGLSGDAGDEDEDAGHDAGANDAGEDAGRTVCSTRVNYGSAWIHPDDHPQDFDTVSGHVTWDGVCYFDGMNSYVILSNGWKPFFMGSSSCGVTFEYTYCETP